MNATSVTSIEWGENKLSAKLQKRLAEPGRRDAARLSRSETLQAGTRRSRRAEIETRRQIRRYPLSSVLLAAVFGMLLGATMNARRTAHSRRNRARNFH